MTAFDLLAQLEAGLPIWLLVDPMLGEPLAIDYSANDDFADVVAARESVWQREIVTVALSNTVALSEHLHPYLIALQGRKDPWLEVSAKIASAEQQAAFAAALTGSEGVAHRIGGWLQSSLHASDLASRLSKLMQVSTTARTSARYQRLADRRAFAWWQHVMGQERASIVLGPITRWVIVDAQGLPACIQGVADSPTTLRAERVLMTDVEWRRFMQGERIHAVTYGWLARLAVDQQSLPAHDRVYGLVERTLRDLDTMVNKSSTAHTTHQELDDCHARAIDALLSMNGTPLVSRAAHPSDVHHLY